MSVVNQAAEWLQRSDRKIWPEHRVVVTRQMTEALAKGKVVVADVGAAAGLALEVVVGQETELVRVAHRFTSNSC